MAKKYNPFKVMGKTSKNALTKHLKADEDHNFETVTNQLNTIINMEKNMADRLSAIEQKLSIVQKQ